MPPKSQPEEKTAPQPPPTNSHFVPAVVSFVSGGQVIAIGDTNKHSTQDIQAAFTSKHAGMDLPFLGLRIKLKRSKDTKHLYDDEDFHVVEFRYLHDRYEIEHHTATDVEKNHFISVTENSPSALKACQDDKAYVIKFRLGGKEGPEVHGHGSAFIGATQHVNSVYNHLSSLPSAQVVDVYLYQYAKLADQIEWSLADQATRTDPLLHYYHTSKKHGKPQGYVQWNKLVERNWESDKPFDVRRGCHDFDNFTVLYGNAEAYEQQVFFDQSKVLRATPIKMGVLQPPNSNGDYYFAALFIPDWEQYQHILEPLTQLTACWQPPPTIKPQFLKEEGEKDPKDRPVGWRAVVMEDNAFSDQANLAIILCRPKEGHPLADMKMPAAHEVGQEMPLQYVYLKVIPSDVTIKARLNALDNHRHFKNPSPEFDVKRRLLTGRDLSVTRSVDLLLGLSKERINELTARLNDSQKDCLQTHCRNVPNGINLIEGPFGSGKTLLAAVLCEIRAARDPEAKTFVAASSNSACDAVVPKFTGSKLMVVRAHALSLERDTLLQPYF